MATDKVVSIIQPPQQTATLAKALVAASKKFKPVVKDSKNPHFGNTYASLGAYIEATKDALADNGLAIVQRPLVDGADQLLETLIIHESGESLQAGVFPIRPVKNDPQGVGSAMSYARRYSYASALNLASEDDDANAGSEQPKQKAKDKQEPPKPTLPDAVREEIMAAAHAKWGGKGLLLGQITAHLDGIARGLGAANLMTLDPSLKTAVVDAINTGSGPATK